MGRTSQQSEGCIPVGSLAIALHFMLLIVVLPIIIVSVELLGLFCVQGHNIPYVM